MSRAVQDAGLIVKCVLAGVLTLVVAAILMVLLVIALAFIVTTPHRGTVGIDVGSIMASNPSYWVVPVLVFSFGFFWEFRRARKMKAS